MKERLVSVAGPTGIGKTGLAIRLAQEFGGEIVNADSRQVYHFLDIGTAKPTPEEMALVPHHLFDFVDPAENFSLGQYVQLAGSAIESIQEKDKLPLLVGGTGQYVWSILEGWQIPAVAPDTDYRQSLEKRAASGGVEELYRELIELDPAAAQKIDRRNVRRVIRALEVHHTAGFPISRLQQKQNPPFKTMIIGLTTNRKELYRRVDLRVEAMIAGGWIDEVKKLLRLGYKLDLPSLSGIGYKQVGMFLESTLSLEEAIQKIKVENHRFIRHQYAWFRLNDERIHWFDVQNSLEPEVFELVRRFIKDV
jgi:tRNA dimethylallyltransferase